ncbi:MAG: cytochrome c oxidase assembly protein [Ectothiorhodospiraceae bacterium]|nr:cytochrome c oxidase assembly protein [Ectothiorhodospiraceae bacterium]
MSQQGANNGSSRTAVKLLLVVVGMFGFGFALVPMYQVFCEVTGFNGFVSTEAATAPLEEIDTDRRVTVEFVSTVNQSHPWRFQAQERRMEVQPGRLYTAYFEIENLRGEQSVTQIIPSVAPGTAGRHFQKTECFCFTEQTFAAGEMQRMPVTFYIDPALSDRTSTVTLSYTLFDLTAGDAPEFDEDATSLHVGAR